MAADEDARPLEFDRVEMDQPQDTAQAQGLACKACGAPIQGEYFSWNGAAVCERCKTTVDTSRRKASRWSTFGRATAFGLGAAIAGAILYYAVIAVTKLEIGLVAILIGYMVGYSVRRGSLGWGGRRFQVLALVLTYYAVGLAYFPLVSQSARESAARKAATRSAQPAASSIAVTDDAGAARAPQRVGALAEIAGIGLILAFCAALPVLSVVGSFPSGLISAAIIGFGMRQAWRMTASLPISITGPYKLGAPPVAS